MSTLRNHCTREQLMAHSMLDAARAGCDISDEEIAWALTTLGEPL